MSQSLLLIIDKCIKKVIKNGYSIINDQFWEVIMKNRLQIRDEMKEVLYAHKDIIAVWEGGSVATGFADEYSDLDLSVICSDDAIEEVYQLISEYLDLNFGIIQRYRVPEPTWHGFSQCYYQTKNVPEYFYFDIAFIKKSFEDKFTESDRHGQAFVWFQKEEMLNTQPADIEKVNNLAKTMYKKGTETFFLMDISIMKYIRRGIFTEAFPPYYAFIARHLAIMLNLKYRPSKADFGLLYGYRDYPVEIHHFIDELFKVKNLEDLNDKYLKARDLYYNLCQELQEYKSEDV